MPLNKAQLQALNQTNFPDNTQQLITPELLRDFNDDMIASMQLTQSMDNYANLSTANIFYGGNQSIEKEYKLFTNGVYWNNNTAGYNNLEIINSITGNIDIAALGGGVRIVSSSLNITNGTFTASLAEGFTYVGNGSGRTSLVSTSSFGSSINTGSFITTSSFNAYTQSINSATASLFTSTSLSLTTASFSGNTLTFTKGNGSTFGVVIPDISGSTINTGSFMTTGSVSGNTLTFTKGDATTFSLTVATGSGGSTIDTGSFATTASFNAYTQSTNIRLDNLESTSASVNISISNLNSTTSSFATSITNLNSATASLFTSASLGLVTASVNLNTITFTKGDTSTFNIVVNTGSAVATDITALNSFTASQETKDITLASVTSSLNTATASLFTSASLGLVTASFSGNTLTFTKGDTSTFGVVIPDISGSTIPAGTVSSSAQILNYNIFATTGSNSFKGGQNISSSANIGDYLGTDYVFISQNGIQLENAIQTNINFNAANNFFSAGGNFFLGNTLGGVGSGSITITANNGGNVSVSGSETNIAGVNFIPFSSSLDTRILATEFTNPSVQSISGSLVLTANTFASGSGTMVHLSSSAQNQVNLVFKNKNDSGTTIISGSNNIFSNPSLPSTGYIRYIGGSNNLYLNSQNGINSQITASAASVSGTRATMNNNIFNSIGTFTINQAVNTGGGDYSQNYISGNGNVTINALSHTGSISLSHNVLAFGSITINAASASVAQIATGISGSGTVNVNGNLVQGNGSMTITSPRFLLPSNTQSSLGNFVAGGTITVTNISSSAAVTSNNNVINGGISYTNAGAAGLGLHTSAGAMSNNYGGGTIIASASAVAFNFNTTSGNNLTLTNQAFSGSLGVGQFTVSRNIFFGQSGILLITGSVDGPAGATPGAFTDNAVIGKSNTIFSNQSGAGYHNSFISNVVGGENLIISASNSFTSTIGGGAYFGRYNANDGVRNKTGQTVFSVGTGTSTARKTGLLIDSGSNMFVEGSLNVSGSTAFTGSVKVASTFQLQLPTGSNQQAGTAVLDGANPGTVTVSNSLVTANSIIMVSKQTLAHTNGYVAVSSKGAGTFTITSNHNGDNDTVGWFIINNS